MIQGRGLIDDVEGGDEKKIRREVGARGGGGEAGGRGGG
jgi:hypothetical protein